MRGMFFYHLIKHGKMKCLKNTKTGNIIRVDDKQAYQIAGNQWKYVSKSEWKSQERGPIVTEEKTK